MSNQFTQIDKGNIYQKKVSTKWNNVCTPQKSDYITTKTILFYMKPGGRRANQANILLYNLYSLLKIALEIVFIKKKIYNSL